MKHLCKDCIYCNFIAKDFIGYETGCRFRPDWVISGGVKKCILHTTIKSLDIVDEETIQNSIKTKKFIGK